MPTAGDYAPTGIAGLDEVLRGGVPRGQLSLIRGSSGAGKTTLGLQFLMEGASNGEPVLHVGTSETAEELRGLARSHGWDLDGVTLHHHPAPALEGDQTMLHPAEVELPRTIEAILAVADEIKPKRLVIDSLAEIRVMARDDFWYRRQLMALRRRFSDEECTVLLLEIPEIEQPTLNSIVSAVIELEQMTPLYGPDRRRLRVVKVRGQDFAMGHHDYKIRTGGLDVFPRLTASEHRRPSGRKLASTGLPAMDDMLHGGLMSGTSTLLLGPSGTAKSLMATQLMVAAAERGERAAMYVFDERVQTLFIRAESVGLPLARHVDEGAIDVRQVDASELSSGEFSHLIKRQVTEQGVRHVVIDSLNGYAYAMPEERLLSLHLHELQSYLSQQGVTAVFTMTQHGMLIERSNQPFDVSYIADVVVLVRHFEFAGRVHKAISVYKSRASSHESSIRELQVTAAGLRIGEPLHKFQGILAGMPTYLGERLHGGDRSESPGG